MLSEGGGGGGGDLMGSFLLEEILLTGMCFFEMNDMTVLG